MDTKNTKASSDMESEEEDEKKTPSRNSGELVKFMSKRPEVETPKYAPRLEKYTTLLRKRHRAECARGRASEPPDKRCSSRKRINEKHSKSPTENKRGADSKSHSQEKAGRRVPRSPLAVPEDKCCPRRRRRRRSRCRRRRRRSCRRRRPRRRRSCRRRRRRSCRRRRSRRRRRRSCRRRRRRRC